MVRAGLFEISSIVNSTTRVDRGAMFAVAPKVMWQESSYVDDINHVLLTTRMRPAVDRTDKRVVLVDTGCGTRRSPGEVRRYEIEHDPDAIPGALHAAVYRLVESRRLVPWRESPRSRRLTRELSQ